VIKKKREEIRRALPYPLMAASGFSNVIFNRICMAQLPASRSISAQGCWEWRQPIQSSWSADPFFDISPSMAVRDGKEAAAAAAAEGVCLHAVTKLSSCATIWPCAFVDGIHFQLRQAFISSSLILFKCNSATRNGVCIHNTVQLCAHIYSFFFLPSFSASSLSFVRASYVSCVTQWIGCIVCVSI
jgi:hypothetical protein